MPLYEYQCEACAHRFERIQQFSDPLLTNCPRCDGSVRKLVSSPAIQFKGSGWYVTDYAKKEKTDPSASEPGPSSEAKAKKEDTAPADTKQASPSTSESAPSPKNSASSPK